MRRRRDRLQEGSEDQAFDKRLEKSMSETGENQDSLKCLSRDRIREFVAKMGPVLEEEADLSFTNGKFPKWMELLLEHDANPMDHVSDKEFADLLGISSSKIYHARRSYPNYALAVAYRQRKYMAELGNYGMKKLLERVEKGSDKMLQILLEVTGKYTPTQKVIDEPSTPQEKRLNIKSLLEELKPKEDQAI